MLKLRWWRFSVDQRIDVELDGDGKVIRVWIGSRTMPFRTWTAPDNRAKTRRAGS